MQELIKNTLESGRTRFVHEVTHPYNMGKTCFSGGVIKRNGVYYLSMMSVCGTIRADDAVKPQKFNWDQGSRLMKYDLENNLFLTRGTMVELNHGFKEDILRVLRSYNLFEGYPKYKQVH